MTVTITAFEQSPDRGRGLARDMRVRWALQEVAEPYAVRLLSFNAMKEPAHLALHPFGQIPTFEDDGLTLFESGAIVLHLAQTRAGLLPEETGARARAMGWMFAAISTVEPPIVEMSMAMLLERDMRWFADRQALLTVRVQERLRQLSAHLGEAEWLDGAFSAADLLMVTVLRRAESSGLLDEQPNLTAYIERAERRPAYQRAFAEQLDTFNRSQPAS